MIDLSDVSQRWLRDLLWDCMDTRLTNDPPRTKSPFHAARRGCIELSAYLEAHAPAGGHDPTLLTKEHAVDFVADLRHRAQHGLPSLGLFAQGSHRTRPASVTQRMAGQNFNGVRQVLRTAMDAGETERIGLGRPFVVAVPTGEQKPGRRRPFPDDVARALASDRNLAILDSLDA
ncbi:hypothetical protein [Streptomyces syringium]|uniref:Uncharacterized protein n=1 Tax=Streptomyces syringium TaxID=76729 RepID=A0ABS4XW66_9ACTN|nr:hypothetical protein [Streptomyces syringium]MBP2400754.1 hypothetical protein [Streptomyces syringium]